MNTDRDLANRVRAELALGPAIGIENVHVEAHDGVVTLTGEVDSLTATCLAARSVMRVEGAVAVINELCVRPHEEETEHLAHGA